jgi:hypothetical protein
MLVIQKDGTDAFTLQRRMIKEHSNLMQRWQMAVVAKWRENF